MASQKESSLVKVVDFKMFGGSLVERSAVTDYDSTVKKKDGIIVSFAPIGENFSGIRLIIENPENVEGVIVGTLEIPFPKDGDTKILVIPNIIELRLFSGNSPSALSSSCVSSDNSSSSSHLSYKQPPQTLADRVKISSIYERPKTFSAQKESRVNPNLTDTLMNIIKTHKSEISKQRTCSNHESIKTNCIMQAINSSSYDYFICGQCRKFLAAMDEYKCNKCAAPVFIDAKGSAKNKFCNKCSNGN